MSGGNFYGSNDINIVNHVYFDLGNPPPTFGVWVKSVGGNAHFIASDTLGMTTTGDLGYYTYRCTAFPASDW